MTTTRVRVRLPTPLRAFTKGEGEVIVEGPTVGAVLAELGSRHAGLLERVLTPEGETRNFVNIYLGSNDVRSLQGLSTLVSEGDVLTIVPAVAGGGP